MARALDKTNNIMEMLKRNVRGAYTIWYRDIVRFKRDRVRMFSSLGMPIVFLFVFGSVCHLPWPRWEAVISISSNSCFLEY